ncbi:hypothetical protein [Tautonia plasticadhaerens]|uniref:PilZ domain-containing protein n=1 Tax=Tautonia plasticadhaerens TaxID=2527974 RepID=A0A518H714_9BACT|nr:hypothetical protein [Tautonia plasticadhaerens]QDV36670.1 hypothetical protein ElP_45990 [Tautonia plasticadhaerens]
MSKLRHYSSFIVARTKVDVGRDRRVFPRYASSGAKCWFGWWEEGSPRVVEAVVVDVSQGGAALVVLKPPRAGQPSWIRPLSLSADWVSGTVARLRVPGRLNALLGHPSRVGIEFHEHCPWQALRAALFDVGGPGSTAGSPPTLPTPRGPGS